MSSVADEKRKLVVAKAAELFDRSGYHKVNMTEIARSAGLEKPTLYHYFKSKDEILFWIHETFINLLLERISLRTKPHSAHDELVEIMCDVLELMHTHRGHVRTFFEHHRELSPEAKDSVRRKRSRYQAHVESTIAEGIQSGEFRDVDPHYTTLALFGMCNWAYNWYKPGDTFSSREVGELLADLFTNGVAIGKPIDAAEKPMNALNKPLDGASKQLNAEPLNIADAAGAERPDSPQPSAA
ncbi:MAG TPA: TetR/AcrR family transcriptional regulator [Solirubrobacteraceae bacterium]|jgi:AcrR family transcriptional regulator